MNKIETVELFINESCDLSDGLKDIVKLGLNLIRNTNLNDEVVARLSDKDYEVLKSVK